MVWMRNKENILNKMKTFHLNCVPFIYKMIQASKANESVSECSKTGLCITVTVLRDVVTREHMRTI